MKNTLSLLFYIKKSKANTEGKAVIYLRVTIDGQRAEFSVRRKVSVDRWNTRSGMAAGHGYESRELNRYLNSIESEVYKQYQKLLENEEHITAVSLRDTYLGKDENLRMVLEIFQEHNNEVNQLIGKDFAAGTAERYRTAKKHVGEFIQAKYKRNDIPVRDVDHKFITGFEYYLKTKRNCSHNTTVKYITNFKKIIRIAYANNWIDKDPFINWRVRLKHVERDFLSTEEIQLLMDTDFHTLRLEYVRDIFVFCCFTGLAYADVKKLTHDDIVIGIDGEKWINTERTKTKTKSNIPILPLALMIIEKYEGSNEVNHNRVLPVLTNQKMNAYLKEIADISGIKKNLTTHLARHTFATTVTLTNGVSLESVSKMLGHRSLRTTQHYAKILNRRVSEDMQMLRKKFRTEDNFSNSSSQSQI